MSNHSTTSQTNETTDLIKSLNLETTATVHHNLSYDDLFKHETRDTLTGYEKGHLTTLNAISVDTGKGYRALSNISEHGGQEVPHLHFHLFGGERVGKMVQ